MSLAVSNSTPNLNTFAPLIINMVNLTENLFRIPEVPLSKFMEKKPFNRQSAVRSERDSIFPLE